MNTIEYLKSMRMRIQSYMEEADRIMEEVMERENHREAKKLFKQAIQENNEELKSLHLQSMLISLLEETNGTRTL